MSKTKSILALSLVFFLALSLSALYADITGDWEMTTQGRRGERTMDIHFEQKGEKITVTWSTPRGGEVKAEGTIKGNDIEWSFTRETPRGDFTMTYKGKIEGDTMTGTMQMGERGSSEWTAKKK
ncbi:MAG: hypothetical protein GQ536_00690 [Candidatus Aminicenantes bacterium]|nr:hypothetical protein [Candidatus Aminicenantes bacterium]